MAKFTIELACDNAAFEPNPAHEIARILHELTIGIRNTAHLFGRYNPDHGTLYDANGNGVGEWFFTRD